MTEENINNPTLQEDDLVLGGDGYQDAQAFPPPIPDGVYTLAQGAPRFETSDGQLKVTFDHSVVGGTEDSKRVMFDRVSTKVFQRSGTKVASIIDHLRALGDRQSYRISDIETLQLALQNAEGRTFKADIRWEAVCMDCLNAVKAEFTPGTSDYKAGVKAVTVRGERRFPELPDGSRSPVVPCPKCGAEIQANARVNRRIPA